MFYCAAHCPVTISKTIFAIGSVFWQYSTVSVHHPYVELTESLRNA